MHGAFLCFARALLESPHDRALFGKLTEKAQLAHRFSVLEASADPTGGSVDAGRFYGRGDFSSTAARMRKYEEHAPKLAMKAIAGLDLGTAARRITHFVMTSCTGFYAPGLDLQIVERSCSSARSADRWRSGARSAASSPPSVVASGHDLTLEQPAVTAARVARFLALATPDEAA